MEDFPRGGAPAGPAGRGRGGPSGPRRTPDGGRQSDRGQRAAKANGKRPALEPSFAPGKRRKGAGKPAVAELDELFTGQSKSVGLLTFTSLSPGMRFLGVVQEVGRQDLTVGLPDGLRGFVPSHLALAAAGEASGSDDDDDDDDEDAERPALRDAFREGQIVVCAVHRLVAGGEAAPKPPKKAGKAGEAAPDGGGSKHRSRKIELSLLLNAVASSVPAASSLRSGMLLPAAVKSVEDHGYILTFGHPPSPLSGFLLAKDYDGEPLVEGQAVICVVSSVDAKRRTVAVVATREALRSTVAAEHEDQVLEGIVPGTLVAARVRQVLPDGLVCSFLTYFSGYVDRYHLGQLLTASFSENQRVTARVLYVDPVTKRVGLTLLPELLAWAAPTPVALPAVGTLVEGAVVVRVDRGVGLLVRLPPASDGEGQAPLGFVHASNVADEVSEDDARQLSSKFKPGVAVAPGRVVGHRLLDGLAILSLKESVVSQAFLSAADVAPGMVVRGVVSVVDHFGALVMITDKLRALCPVMHFSDAAPTSKLGGGLKVGARVRVRVLTRDAESKRLTVSHKKTLVASALPAITEYADAVEGMVTHGFITGVTDYGCFVTFYGGVKGLAHVSELGLAPGGGADGAADAQRPADAFRVGQVVKCRVVAVEAQQQRLSLSFITNPKLVAKRLGAAASAASPAKSVRTASAAGPAGVVEGELVDAVVHSVTDDGAAFLLDLERDGVPVQGRQGLLPVAHLSDWPAHCAAFAELVKPGRRLEGLLVLNGSTSTRAVLGGGKASDGSGGGSGGGGAPVALCSWKGLLLGARGEMPRTVADVRPKGRYAGYVANVSGAGVFVRFLGRLTGLATIANVADTFVAAVDAHFAKGQSVRAEALAVDEEADRFTISLKQSRVASGPADPPPLARFFEEQETLAALKVEAAAAAAAASDEGKEQEADAQAGWHHALVVGQEVQAVVQEARDYGLVLDLPAAPDVVGFVAAHLLPAAAAAAAAGHAGKGKAGKTGKAGKAPAQGDAVTARILDVSPADGIVDLALVATAAAGKKAKKADRGAAEKADVAVLREGRPMDADVQLVKDEYVVLTVPGAGDAVVFAAGRDYNLRAQAPEAVFQPGQRVQVVWQATVGPNARHLVHVALPVAGATANGHASNAAAAAGAAGGSKQRRSWAPGDTVRAKVTAVSPLQVEVIVHQHVRGRVHVCEAARAPEHLCASPLLALLPGQTINATVLAVSAGRAPDDGEVRGAFLDLSLREDAAARARAAAEGGGGPARAEDDSAPPRDLAQLREGQEVVGYVRDVRGRFLWLVLSPTVTGRLRFAGKADAFHVGTALRCRVARCDVATRQLDLKLATEPAAVDAADEALAIGDVLPGQVSRVVPGIGLGVLLRMPSGAEVLGRVHITQLADRWRDLPLEAFKVGQAVTCCVISMPPDDAARPDEGEESRGEERQQPRQVELSLRASAGGRWDDAPPEVVSQEAAAPLVPEIESVEQLAAGQQVTGYVKSCSSVGCFVWLPTRPPVQAHVLIKNLSDGFVKDPPATFPPGRRVRGTLLSVDQGPADTAGDAQGRPRLRVSLSLRRQAEGGGRSLADLREGELVDGEVRRIEGFGVFVAVDGTNGVVGLCHISEAGDAFVGDLARKFSQGDRVRALVTKVDVAKRRLSLSMKPSRLQAAEAEAEAEAEAGRGGVREVDGEEREEEDEEDEDEDEEEQETEHDDVGGREDVLEEEDTADDVTDEQEESDREGLAPSAQRGKKRKAGKKGSANSGVGPMAVAWSADDAVEAAIAAAGGGSETGGGVKAKAGNEAGNTSRSQAKRQKLREREQREREIEAAEQQLLREGSGEPSSVEGLERLVAASPGSSYAWIRYMAFLISITEVDAARNVAERALEAISYRNDGERLNVWIAYLNLENTYGTPPDGQAALKLFQRAIQHADPKRLYVAMADIFARTDRLPLAHQIAKTAAAKFPTSAKVWVRVIELHLQANDGDAAKRALERALLSLPKRKHIKVITRAALLEFRVGSPDRARAIMEGVLRNQPKRTDLWLVYVDQEIRLGPDQGLARQLLERATSLALPPKKMKPLFRKFLEYERRHGDEARVQHVKEKARLFVQAATGGE